MTNFRIFTLLIKEEYGNTEYIESDYIWNNEENSLTFFFYGEDIPYLQFLKKCVPGRLLKVYARVKRG